MQKPTKQLKYRRFYDVKYVITDIWGAFYVTWNSGTFNVEHMAQRFSWKFGENLTIYEFPKCKPFRKTLEHNGVTQNFPSETLIKFGKRGGWSSLRKRYQNGSFGFILESALVFILDLYRNSRFFQGWKALQYSCCWQGWTLNFKNTRHSGEWSSKCTRPDQFSLAQKFTPVPYLRFIPTILVIFYSFDWSQVAFGAFSFFLLLFSLTTLETPGIHFHIFLFCMRSVYGRTRNDQKAGKVWKTIRLKLRQARGWPRIISLMKNSI